MSDEELQGSAKAWRDAHAELSESMPGVFGNPAVSTETTSWWWRAVSERLPESGELHVIATVYDPELGSVVETLRNGRRFYGTDPS